MAQVANVVLSGDGVIDLGAAFNVTYWLGHFVTLPSRAAILDSVTPRRILHAGWIALGFSLDAGDGTSRPTYWSGRWLDAEDYAYVVPTEEYGAHFVRYHVGVGGSLQFAAYT